jgi:uncharacterized OB-fold protein
MAPVGERAVRPAPATDRDSQPWWDALARHEFVLQRCAECAAWRWPARAICNRCASFEWSWQPASGRAEVAAFVVNHHGFLASDGTPYAVITVQLAEQDDLQLPGSFAGALHMLRIGLPLQLVFDDVVTAEGDPFTLASWRPADNS